MEYYTLRNQVRTPVLALGTALNDDMAQVAQSVRAAAACGYRAIDTAEAYHNQTGVGEGLRTCGLAREEMYISSKVWNNHHGYEETLRAFEQTRRELGLEYLDQYLIHWPGQTDSFVPTWKALEHLYHEGFVRVIGVSNFLSHHLERLFEEADVLPMVDQLELNPSFVPWQTVRLCREKRIQIEATRPLCWGRVNQSAVLCGLAAQHGKTPAQIALRWQLQHGFRPLPKSVRPQRMAENIDVFDFALSAGEMAAVDALDTGVRETGQDPDTFWMLDTDFKAENARIMAGQ